MLNRQAGLTLIETVLVLLVAAIIIGGIWLGYSQLRLNEQVNDTVAVLDQTIQVTRDYLASQPSVPVPGSANSLSPSLYNAGLMPSQLSYAYSAANNIYNNNVNSDTQIFLSPLGTEFFVQYPNGTPPPAKFFEVRIRFINSSGSYNIDQCVQLMPKLIGTTRIIQDRGLVGYWYGWVSAWNSNITPLGGNANPMQSLTQLLPTANSQYYNCTGAADVRLYFAMRP